METEKEEEEADSVLSCGPTTGEDDISGLEGTLNKVPRADSLAVEGNFLKRLGETGNHRL